MTDRSMYWVDASSNNEPIDIAAYAAAGHEHIALKATEGLFYEWENGHAIQDQAHAHGLTVDRYHWVRPDSGTAKQQAAFFVGKVATHMKPGDGWFPDWERSKNYTTGQYVPDPPDPQWAEFLAELVAEVERLLEARLSFPLERRLYTGNWYLDGKPHMQAEARKFDVVLSDYTTSSDDAMDNRFTLNLAARQFTSVALVAGFSRPVDYNRWLKPREPADPMEDVMAMYKDKADFEASLKQIVEGAVNDRIDNLLEDYDGTPSRIRTFVRRIGPKGYVEPTAHPKADDK